MTTPNPNMPNQAGISPHTVGDRPTTDDKLGFTPYVAALSAFLLHKETIPPMTLSIEGSWGSGKSSFMLQLQKQLDDKGAKTVWFNAWRHERDEELWAAFALDFTSKLAAKLPPIKRSYLHLKLRCLRFDWRRGWFAVTKFVVLTLLFVWLTTAVIQNLGNPQSPVRQVIAAAQRTSTVPETKQSGEVPKTWEELLFKLSITLGGAAVYTILGIVVVRTLAEVLGNPLEPQLAGYIRDPKYETRTTFVETFHTDFDLLIRTYAGKEKVFVFLDDLDRCEVPKAADLMQAVNLLISESAPVFYILGLDREKIAAGLAAKYEKLLPYLMSRSSTASPAVVGTEFGFTFLEKFIQIPFLIPRPTEQDVDRLLDSLSRTSRPATKQPSEVKIDAGLLVQLSSDSEAVRSVVRMVAPALDHNPRRLKQFVNLFRVRALLASQTGLFGQPRDERFESLTFEQLGKLVAISLRWPRLLAEIEEIGPALLTDLQQEVWTEEKIRKTVMLEESRQRVASWLTDRNLRELIAFLPPKSRDLQQFGLHRVDVQRFFEIAPVIPGRGMGERNVESKARAAAASNETSGTISGGRRKVPSAGQTAGGDQGVSESSRRTDAEWQRILRAEDATILHGRGIQDATKVKAQRAEPMDSPPNVRPRFDGEKAKRSTRPPDSPSPAKK